MTDKCQAERRFDLQLQALRDYVDQKFLSSREHTDLKTQALQAEYSKSELNYPTRQLLDERLMGLASNADVKEKLDGLNLQMKLQWAFLVALLIMFLANYLRS